MLAIKNARIYPVDKPVIESGIILTDKGKIAAVGEKVSIPADAKVIDAYGKSVFPGFIDAHSHLGLRESSIGSEGKDTNESTNPVTPNLRAIDAFNPMDITVKEAREAGVTACAVGPGSANVVGGTFMAIKTYGIQVDDMVIKDPVAMKVAFGENPKKVYKAKGRTPITRMGIAALLRELLSATKRYDQHMQYGSQDASKLPKYEPKLDAMLPVIRKEIPIKAHAHRADDIFTALRIAKEFDIKITIEHCTDGHLISDYLVDENVPVVVGPSLGRRSKIELANKSFKTVGLLSRAGIKVAITTDSPVAPLHTLPMVTGMAIAAGMDFHEALRAITLNAAEIIGIQDRVGSITVGKDADLVVFEEEPFEVGTKPWMVLIDGQIVAKPSDKSEGGQAISC